MKEGGFDVIIGNPPYVKISRVRKKYTTVNYETKECPDIYALVLERVIKILSQGGRSGMILPLSLGFSNRFDSCRKLLFAEYGKNWFSSYGRIPSALFSYDVRVRNTIHIGHKSREEGHNYTTRMHRWFEDARPVLFPTLEYASFDMQLWQNRIPKLNTTALARAFEACFGRSKTTFNSLTSTVATPYVLYFKKTAYNWLNFCRKLPPCYDDKGESISHTKFGEIYFRDEEACNLSMLLANGKIMFTFWCAMGDDFDVTRWNFLDFPIDLCKVNENIKAQLTGLVPVLEEEMVKAVQFKLNAGRRVGNYNLAKCRHVTDVSDRLFAGFLGLDSIYENIELYYAQIVKTPFEDVGD